MAGDVVLALNEAMVRQGQNPASAYEPLLAMPDFAAWVKDGARVVFMPRLPCMPDLIASGLGFFEAVSGAKGANGKPLGPVQQAMVKRWLAGMEAGFSKAGALAWLP